MLAKKLMILGVLSFLLPTVGRNEAISKTIGSICQQCKTITIPMFLSPGEEIWVRSWLVAVDGNHKPQYDKILDENFFYAQAPAEFDLENGSLENLLSLGFLHTSCGTNDVLKIVTYTSDILVTPVQTTHVVIVDPDDIIRISSRQSGEDLFAPRLKLQDAFGNAVREVQVLPYTSNERTGTVARLLGLERDEVVPGYTLEVTSPINHLVRVRTFSVNRERIREKGLR